MGRVTEGLRNTGMFCGAGTGPVDLLVIHVLNRHAGGIGKFIVDSSVVGGKMV